MDTVWSDAWKESLTVAESFLSTLLKESVQLSIRHRELHTEEPGNPGETTPVSVRFHDPDHGDLLVQLEEAWLPLLSSRMMGVEESTFNEVTQDLVKRFSEELATTVQEALRRQGVDLNSEPVELASASAFFDSSEHSRFLEVVLHADGLADELLNVTLWMAGDGLPDSVEEVGEVVKESSIENNSGTEAGMGKEKKEFKSMGPEEMVDSAGVKEPVVSGRHVQFEEFEDEDLTPEKGARGLELLKDIEMDLSVELGRIELPLGKVLELTRGSVIELERLAGEPVDILVNGHKIAYGEVVVIDEHFGVRISNLITTRQKLVELQ